MIIGINGYIGSGKDTVGQIIQYLTTPKKDISYSGSYNSYVMDLGMGGTITSPWKVKKFAGKLKEIASLLTGIPVEKFEDQEFKKTELGGEWRVNRPDWVGGGIIEASSPLTVREFLQKLGTEAIREGLHTNAWVNALFADYEPVITRVTEKAQPIEGDPKRWKAKFGRKDLILDTENFTYDKWDHPNWLITDTRFPNEAKAIKDRGGVVIRVDRRSSENVSYIRPERRHASETSLDNWEFDYFIDNNGSIDELIEKVRKMMDKITSKNDAS